MAFVVITGLVSNGIGTLSANLERQPLRYLGGDEGFSKPVHDGSSIALVAKLVHSCSFLNGGGHHGIFIADDTCTHQTTARLHLHQHLYGDHSQVGDCARPHHAISS